MIFGVFGHTSFLTPRKILEFKSWNLAGQPRPKSSEPFPDSEIDESSFHKISRMGGTNFGLKFRVSPSHDPMANYGTLAPAA